MLIKSYKLNKFKIHFSYVEPIAEKILLITKSQKKPNVSVTIEESKDSITKLNI
jgi:hypothetical protein